MRHGGNEQHDDCGDRRDREPRVDRRDEGERRYGERKNRQQRDFAPMRNKHADGAAIDRTAKRSDEIVEGRHQRASDAHLGHVDGGQYCPQRQGKLQELRERQSRERGYRHPDGQR
jgi:hypothetical protein